MKGMVNIEIEGESPKDIADLFFLNSEEGAFLSQIGIQIPPSDLARIYQRLIDQLTALADEGLTIDGNDPSVMGRAIHAFASSFGSSVFREFAQTLKYATKSITPDDLRRFLEIGKVSDDRYTQDTEQTMTKEVTTAWNKIAEEGQKESDDSEKEDKKWKA